MLLYDDACMIIFFKFNFAGCNRGGNVLWRKAGYLELRGLAIQLHYRSALLFVLGILCGTVILFSGKFTTIRRSFSNKLLSSVVPELMHEFHFL